MRERDESGPPRSHQPQVVPRLSAGNQMTEMMLSYDKPWRKDSGGSRHNDTGVEPPQKQGNMGNQQSFTTHPDYGLRSLIRLLQDLGAYSKMPSCADFWALCSFSVRASFQQRVKLPSQDENSTEQEQRKNTEPRKQWCSGNLPCTN
ncbi:hypothetical protein BCON_0311g00050 [Botryotinia convoluta]|uniref:Uncharacterized protein n=1 Tax=Botryotinia convoluta TaxID=54673 RepID=A0A4Z1HIT8_9HELO|nr:hypothetical protein BCON_0311g00050 [Botryotinia convoluta]